MRKKLLISFFLFISLKSLSQSRDISIQLNEKTAGKNLITQKEIKAKEYIFPDRIENSYVDTTSGTLTVQLRGLSKNGKSLSNKGDILVYDLNSDSVEWTNELNYQTTSIKQFGSTIIASEVNKSYRLTIEMGQNLWEVQDNLFYLAPTDKIGLGYKFKYSPGFTNTLDGIDLRTGHVIWQRQLNREYGWNDLLSLNDSTLIAVAGGLHSINLKNGTGWDYSTITGKKHYGGTIAANAAGAALGLLTGVFMMTTGYNLVSDVVSNVISDSTSFYFASKEKIARIEKTTGKVLWSYPLPAELASNSTIFTNDSLVYMINKGYAFMDGQQLNFGTPFIAAFNKVSGKQKFFALITSQKDPILGFKRKNGVLITVFKDHISEYSMENGGNISDKGVDTAKYGELKYFEGDNVYINSKDSFITMLSQSDTSKTYIFTTKEKTLVLDNKFNIVKQIDFEYLYICFLRDKNLKFLSRGNQVSVVNKDDKVIADLNATIDATLIGKRLYDVQDKNLLEIDISDLIENN